jgi:hypothetical protein
MFFHENSAFVPGQRDNFLVRKALVSGETLWTFNPKTPPPLSEWWVRVIDLMKTGEIHCPTFISGR